jgi:membrane-associated phospholipid phosphatase
LSFDRREVFEEINSHHSSMSDGFFNAYTGLGDGMAISLILLTLFGARAFRNVWFAVTAAVCNVVPALVAQAIKLIVAAPRPLRYWEKDSAWIHIADGWRKLEGHHSFPSGHTAGAFSLFCFLSLLLPKRFAPFGVLLFLMALLVGYSRMYLAAHFYADVYVGSIVGTLTTLAVYFVMERLQPRFYGRNEKATTLDDDHDGT